MDWKEDIKARLIAAIRKTFPAPTPLVGPKWFVAPPGGKPADYQFLGVRKLAKATGIGVPNVARFIACNLDLAGLDVRVAIEDEWKMHFFRLPPGSGASNGAMDPPKRPNEGPAAQ
jgi:hypothetical protein